MNKKKGCCLFFQSIFRKKAKNVENPQPNPIASTVKTSFEDNNDITSKKLAENEESKQKNNSISEKNSIFIPESDPNSFFYDKNSALIEVSDKVKALENLQEAYGIINKDKEMDSGDFPKKQPNIKEQFTKVIVGINFKEILAGEDSIIFSERSDLSSINPSND